MKKNIIETDIIGGQGSLTKKEELALKEYFAKKKKRISERKTNKRAEKKSKDLTAQRKVLLATAHNKNGEFCAEMKGLCIFRNLNFNRKICAF